MEPEWIVQDRRTGRHGVAHAAIWIEGVKTGRLAPLSRAEFSFYMGRLTNASGLRIGKGSPVGFGPVNDRVHITNYDEFPNHPVLTQSGTGSAVLDHRMDPLLLPEDKVSASNLVSSGGRAPPVQSPPLKEAGIYTLACRRHAWEKAWLVAVENPYAAVSGGRSSPGLFVLDGVPPGKWTLRVWHPVLAPVTEQVEVEVGENRLTEVGIEFRPPE